MKFRAWITKPAMTSESVEKESELETKEKPNDLS